jgi:uncharacterized protein (DUF2147 family)
MLCTSFANGQGIFGRWWTKDRKSIVYIYQCDNNICGRLEEIVKPDKPEDKRFKGFQILKGFKQRKEARNEYEAGRITDPRNNKDYKAVLTLDGNKLYVRGYIGFELLGQTQTWERVE